MAYYLHSIKMLRLIIEASFRKRYEPKERDVHDQLLVEEKDLIPHLLWMLDSIEEMTDNSCKAACWMGYVIGKLEALKVLSFTEAEKLLPKM